MREEQFPSMVSSIEVSTEQAFPIEDGHPVEDHSLAAVSTAASIQERHPDWPILHVSGYLSRHGKEDQQAMADHVRGAKVYVVETPGSEAATMRYQLAADVPNTKLERFFRRKKPIEVALLGTHAAVCSMDIRGSVPEEKALLEAFDKVSLYTGYLEADTYGQALTNTRDHFMQFAALNNQREDGMPQRFEDQMAKLLVKRPDLASMESLDVRFTMGSMHGLRLNKLLPAHGVPITREFPMKNGNYLFSYTGELVRTFSLGREPQEELVKRAYTERIIDLAWEGVIKPEVPMPDGLPYERLAASVFDDDQMVHLYEMAQATEKHEDWNGILDYIHTVLATNNLPALPHTAKEVEEAARVMLSRQKSFAPQKNTEQEQPKAVSTLRAATTVLKLAAVIYASSKDGCYQNIRPQ